MLFIVDGRFTPGSDPEPRMLDERKRVKEMKEEGALIWGYRHAHGGGAFMLIEAPDRETLDGMLATLPFVELGIMSVEAHEVESLDFIWKEPSVGVGRTTKDQSD